MSDDIPNIDPDLGTTSGGRGNRRDELEFELLEAEAALRRFSHREVRQRYIIKWLAVATGVIVILGMAGVLWHLVHNAFWGPFLFANPAFSVAMIGAPVTSITAITVVLFIGAFRRFEDKDMETASNGAAAGASFFRGG